MSSRHGGDIEQQLSCRVASASLEPKGRRGRARRTTPRIIGDTPHGRVASDFIRSVLELYTYEREGDRALLPARGILTAWLDGLRIAVHDLHTGYGLLSYSLRRNHGRMILQIARHDHTAQVSTAKAVAWLV